MFAGILRRVVRDGASFGRKPRGDSTARIPARPQVAAGFARKDEHGLSGIAGSDQSAVGFLTRRARHAGGLRISHLTPLGTATGW